MRQYEFIEAFQAVQKNVHQNSKDKGFWDGPDNANVPTKLMLIVSELAEAMEEHRKLDSGYRIDEIQYKSEDGIIYRDQEVGMKDGKMMYKPEGFAIELADAVIRIMDLCEYLGIDLADAIMIKSDYNRGREFRHGNKAY